MIPQAVTTIKAVATKGTIAWRGTMGIVMAFFGYMQFVDSNKKDDIIRSQDKTTAAIEKLEHKLDVVVLEGARFERENKEDIRRIRDQIKRDVSRLTDKLMYSNPYFPKDKREIKTEEDTL